MMQTMQGGGLEAGVPQPMVAAREAARGGEGSEMAVIDLSDDNQ